MCTRRTAFWTEMLRARSSAEATRGWSVASGELLLVEGFGGVGGRVRMEVSTRTIRVVTDAVNADVDSCS